MITKSHLERTYKILHPEVLIQFTNFERDWSSHCEFPEANVYLQMDEVSPAIPLRGMDKIEAGSWENASPPSSECLSPTCDSMPSSSDFTKLDHRGIYSVETMDGNPDGSRASTVEPLSPPHLEVLQVSEGGMPEGEDTQFASTSDDQGLSGMEDYSGYQSPLMPIANTMPQQPQQQETQEPHSTLVSSTSSPPSSAVVAATGGDRAAVKNIDICGGALPACISFGTHLPPEKQDQNIMVALEGSDLWHQFFQAGTEMIITKSGRRMFPGIVVSAGGLDPEIKYTVALEFIPVDNARYKYINTKWVNIGKAEGHCEEMLKYIHPDSPSTGKHWMSSKISFKKIKVTNNKNHKRGQVVALNSMHKYQPRVVISRFVSKKNIVPIFTHDLVECTFIGVTAYQNDQVTQLKIDHNPFAKAFRENGSDNESFSGFGVSNQWPPMSPILSPYGAFSPDGQGSLPALSPSCIPSAGHSPITQFNAAFGNWETPPYSPTAAAAASYRAPFSNTGLHSPLFPDHRQILSTRLMAQDSPPISPLLYSPTGYAPIPAAAGTAMAHPAHQLHPMQAPAALQSQQHYTAAALASSNNAALMPQQQLLKPLATSMGEIWSPKEYTILAYDGASGSAGTSFQHDAHQGYLHPAVPKIEVDSSPASINLDVPQ